MADAASHALKLLGPQAHLSAQLLSSPIVDVTFADTVGAPNQTAYLVTSSRRLYRSDDSGATWNIEPLPDADDAPEVLEVHVAAHDARHVFVRGAGITNWMSQNGGASYTAYRSGGAPLLGFKWHPLSPGLALAHTLSRGCNESALVDTHAALTADACSFEVVRTDDFGASWKTLASGVLQYEWGGRAHWRPPWWRWQQAHSWRARHALPLGPNARRWMALRRHALTRREEAGDYVYLLLARPMAPPRPPLRMVRSGNLMRTASDMAHAENLLPHGSVVSFAFQGDHLFAATAHTYRGALASMMVSSDHGRTFHRARGARSELLDGRWKVLDVSHGAVLLLVQRHDELPSVGDLFVSDADGLVYTLSLRDCVETSFARVEGVDGGYVVQQLSGLGGADGPARKAAVEAPRLRTLITHNRGAAWSLLRAPAASASSTRAGAPCALADGCSLQLAAHAAASGRSIVVSRADAAGVVLAVGHPGPHLRHDAPESWLTYLSRDGGRSWEEAAPVAMHGAIGAHASVLLLAPDAIRLGTASGFGADPGGADASSLRFSTDEGLTWESVPLGDVALPPEAYTAAELLSVEAVAGVPHAPLSSSCTPSAARAAAERVGRRRRRRRAPRQGVLLTVRVEVAAAAARRAVCRRRGVGIRRLRARPPHQRLRRRRAANCLGAPPALLASAAWTVVRHTPAPSAPCPCTASDYECDFDHERRGDGAEAGAPALNGSFVCVRVMAAAAEPPWMAGRAFCAIHGPEATYYERSGYRLVPGDSCALHAEGAVNLLGRPMPCACPWHQRISLDGLTHCVPLPLLLQLVVVAVGLGALCTAGALALYATAVVFRFQHASLMNAFGQGGAFELIGRTRNAAPPGGWSRTIDARGWGNSF